MISMVIVFGVPLVIGGVLALLASLDPL